MNGMQVALLVGAIGGALVGIWLAVEASAPLRAMASTKLEEIIDVTITSAIIGLIGALAGMAVGAIVWRYVVTLWIAASR